MELLTSTPISCGPPSLVPDILCFHWHSRSHIQSKHETKQQGLGPGLPASYFLALVLLYLLPIPWAYGLRQANHPTTIHQPRASVRGPQQVRLRKVENREYVLPCVVRVRGGLSRQEPWRRCLLLLIRDGQHLVAHAHLGRVDQPNIAFQHGFDLDREKVEVEHEQ